VFELCLDQQEIILSHELLQELGAALEKKPKVPRTVSKKTVEYLKEHASVYRMKGPYKKISRDSGENGPG
jgi:hypothetical protein